MAASSCSMQTGKQQREEECQVSQNNGGDAHRYCGDIPKARMVQCAPCSQIQLPSPSQLGCLPRTCPDVCTEDHHWHNTPAAEQVWTMRSSENNPVFLCPLPPQCAVQGTKGAVLLLLLFRKLHKNLGQTKGENAPCCL